MMSAQISAQTRLLFVAPFVMGLGGLATYVAADRFARAKTAAPAE